MKRKLLSLLLMLLMTLMPLTACCDEDTQPVATSEPTYRPAADAPAKPVIYLYPEEETDINVQLDFNGTLTSTYPAYEEGWNVTAQPDGTLTDANGREYYCLFWEGESRVPYDLSTGFCIAGENTRAFLEESLAQLGLTDKEANEFLIYWLPQMEHNAYNLISFQADLYADNAKLTVSPAPDSVLRVFMAWMPLEKPVEVEPQVLAPFAREGFAVVEWGGAKVVR